MNKKVLLFFVMALFSLIGAKAAVIPASYYSTVGEGTFYLYNVNQGKFLQRLSNNYPAFTDTPVEVTLTAATGGYTVKFSDGYFMHTGEYKGQYLWTDGVAGSENEQAWVFNLTGTKVYQIVRPVEETFGNNTGTFYANGTNAAIEATADCQWALITEANYNTYLENSVINANYFSTLAAGDFYLYNVTKKQFMAPEALSDDPTAMRLAEVADGVYSIQVVSTSKYEKLGLWKGQYLWSNAWDDGKDAFFKWTFTTAGTKTYKLSITASSQDASFTEGTTYYLNTANSVTETAAEADEWALVTEANWTAFQEGLQPETPVDPEEPVTPVDPEAEQYDLTLADGSEAHGTVTFLVGNTAVTTAAKGSVVTVSVAPAEGWSAKDVSVRAYTEWAFASVRTLAPALQNEQEVTANADGTWTFTMPEANALVSVSYAKNLQDAWIQAIADQEVTGEAVTPAIVVKDGDETLTLDEDYTVTYSDNILMGEATVTLTGMGDYAGEATATFNIVKTVTVAAGSYMTYYGEYGLSLTDYTAEGVVLSTVTAVDGAAGTVTLTALQSAPAQTPLIIYNGTDAAQAVTLTTTDEAAQVEYAPEFKGTLVEKEMPASGNGTDYYVLSKGKDFVWVKDAGTIAAHKCWIEIAGQDAGAARRLTIVFEGGQSTGISEEIRVKSEEFATAAVYDLQGRRMATSQFSVLHSQLNKGLYIVNGKKVVVR